MELTMRNLLAGGKEVDRRDFLARAEVLGACGMTVLISDYFDTIGWPLISPGERANASASSWVCRVFMNCSTKNIIRELPGGILENFGRLFKNDLKVYVYPLQRSPTDELQTIHTVQVKPDLQPLYDYLVGRGSFVQLDNYNPEYLPIFSRDVLKRIADGDESWDQMVPPQVAEIIRRRGFFGYKKTLKDGSSHSTE